jgi:C4-type Zn-finger protein
MRERCPLCRATEFQLSAQTVLTPLLRFFSIRRVRCMNCWRRYYWFRVGKIRRR